MKKILVISDTHGDIDIIDVLIKENLNDIDKVIHLGDNSKDMNNAIDKYKNIKFYKVLGNCDFHKDDPKNYILETNDKRIFITHGSDYNVKSSYMNLYYKALEKKISICLFGHTHSPFLTKKNNIIFMNPGSPSYPRSQEGASYGLISFLENNDVSCKIVSIEKKQRSILYEI